MLLAARHTHAHAARGVSERACRAQAGDEDIKEITEQMNLTLGAYAPPAGPMLVCGGFNFGFSHTLRSKSVKKKWLEPKNGVTLVPDGALLYARKHA